MQDSPTRLRVAFALQDARLRDQLFPPSLRQRLDAVAEVIRDEPIRDWAEAGAAEVLASVDVMITSWGAPRVSAAICERAPGLKLVAHAAGTVRPYFDPACYSYGVQVTTAAQANAWPVAQWTLAMILLAGKRVWPLTREFAITRRRFSPGAGVGNYGVVVGLVGASRIGRQVAELLRPHGYRVLLSDPTLTPETAGALGAELVGLAELMSDSDIVSLHAPVLPSTIGMINAQLIASMRDGATLINSARGVLVDHDALREHCGSGRVNAVLDVTHPEPLPADDRLWEMANVVLTPHIAGAVGNEVARLGESAVAEVEALAHGRALIHPVSETAYDGAA